MATPATKRLAVARQRPGRNRILWQVLNRWDTATSARVRHDRGFATPPSGLTDTAFAIGVAAADHAMRLPFPAPSVENPAPRPAPSVDNSTAAEIREHANVDALFLCARRGPEDALHVARYCVKFCPANPADWAERHVHIHAEAARLVTERADEIHAIATTLFRTGEYRHPGTPADNEYFAAQRNEK